MPQTGSIGGREHLVTGYHAGQRVDVVLADIWPELSRTEWQNRIQEGYVELDNRPCKPSTPVMVSSRIVVAPLPIPKSGLQSAGKLDLLYEDDDVLVLNKPAGLLVHPKPGKVEASVAGSFALKVNDPDSLRPGIVHRLDKDTSGVMIVARNPRAKQHLQLAFKTRTTEKTYWALVWGQLGLGVQRLRFGLSRSDSHPGRVVIDPIGRPAETYVRQLTAGKTVSLVEARPVTGRTHQIRVHLSAIKHPILGDVVYGRGADEVVRQMLHAYQLTVPMLVGGRQTFTAPLPIDFQHALKQYNCPMPRETLV